MVYEIGTGWLAFFLFLIFISAVYKGFGLLIQLVKIAVISGLFPVAAYFIGIEGVPLTLDSILTFALLGLGAYLLYKLLDKTFRIGALLAKIVAWPFGVLRKKEKKVIIIHK